MDKIWTLKPKGDEAVVERLARALCMPKQNPTEKDLRTYRIVSNLLVQRGITNFEQSKAFFRPDLNHLHDPFLMKDMDRAVERILFAVSAKEKILVYGDYDVDGTSAVALVYSYLENFYSNIDYYIPDRYEEGYGVSFKGVDYAESTGVSLIICLDCGIKATEEIAYAGEKNIDFIVCDHHLPGKELPKAYAILDAKVEGNEYPYDELSGCGVGFKLIQALQRRRGLKGDGIIPYLDLVAISIAADVVPLTGENRILAYYGLKVLNHKPRVGLEAILAFANVKHKDDVPCKTYFNRELTISDLGFLIGPRINAAGRMESGRNAVELLIAKDKQRAENIADKINENNESRKNKDQEATREAKQILSELNTKNLKSIVLYNENWHQGIIGIVASRISEEENKPTIIFTKNNGIITGSARSVKNFDIYTAIEKCRHLLTHFGGHRFAAGLSMEEQNFEEFKSMFEREVENTIEEKELIPEISVDMDIELSDVNDKLLRILSQFQPFGPENAEPVFSSNQIYDANKVRNVGKNHLKFAAITIKENIVPISCIGFSLGAYYDLLKYGRMIDICYTIEENTYQGNSELQLNVKDIRESKENAY
ncbi:MAG: single-stranded-DNA-specific exonuclease RecJ [Bacteroidales bacterium]|nr:single-stranded-DNA-specific exonuclease RecJ [Candidatus Scybalousia scybalohippi]MCQ2327302.1 single-stranded-DNA-specific exonuclease RecJ [Bacteroidales bacterium]